jgi:integrase
MQPGKPYTLYKRDRVYYARFKLPNGKWSTAKTTGLTSKGTAERWCIEYLSTGRIVIKENVTFAEFSKNFFDWDGLWAMDKRARGLRLSKHHCRERSDLLKNHIVPFFGEMRLTMITRVMIKLFRDELFKEGYSGSTINKALSLIKTILEAAEEHSLIQQVPRIDRAADRPQARGILTVEEARSLFTTPWTDVRAYVGNLLACTTGLRLGEIQALKIGDIHLDENYIHLRCSWNNRLREMNATTKTGKSRYVFFSTVVKNAILQLLEHHPEKDSDSLLFYSSKIVGKPAETELFVRTFYKALAAIGVDEATRRKRNIVFHSWRHFANSLYINSKIPLLKVQSMIGHSTLEMTERYYHLHHEDMDDIRQVQDSFLLPATIHNVRGENL